MTLKSLCLSVRPSLSLSHLEGNKPKQFLTAVEAFRNNPRRHNSLTCTPCLNWHFTVIDIVYPTLLLSRLLEKLTLQHDLFIAVFIIRRLGKLVTLMLKILNCSVLK